MKTDKKKDKKAEGRVTSIARKINLNNMARTFFAYAGMDIVVFVLLAAIFVVGMDLQMAGAFSFSYFRKISFQTDLWSAVYTVTDINDQTLYQVPVGVWLSLFRSGGIVLLAFQVLDLISLAVSGTAQVRRQLRPLNQIAARAQQLSEMAFDETKYHSLENAISSLKVDAMENGIHMHDKELQGIETALNGLLERIRVSYKQQSQFVSDASHELRTPIAVIQGYVNMLDRWGKEDTAILEESIEAIKNEANHMQKLVEQLLFLARGDSNRQNLDMQVHELNGIMREVYDESLMIDESHIYRFEESGNVQLYADCDMLKQSARILIDNAAKYTKQGEEILIRVGAWNDGSPFYGIQDNGIGMSQEDVAHAFDRFYRADSVRNSKTGGTGLGLSIAKWIVDKHQGYYDIVSREGLGTRFSVVFPRCVLSS
ncbi:MAG: HAMP domain-containing histidine kinase [Lachnospiraceae bacterium]|nr:HAMP domain-containing histidine kinase [Lachnospiraceae bacterium]